MIREASVFWIRVWGAEFFWASGIAVLRGLECLGLGCRVYGFGSFPK